MEQQHEHGTSPEKRFRLRSRRRTEPLSVEDPRFHIFLIDTGWNAPVSKVLRSHLPLFHQFCCQDRLYMLTPEQSVRILKSAPEHIGKDPMVVVYDLHSPHDALGDKAGNYRGFRLNLGLIKNPEQAIQRLQHFLRFVALNRTSDCLEQQVQRELHREGAANWVKVLREASEASLELL
jgi:hypothetical protein